MTIAALPADRAPRNAASTDANETSGCFVLGTGSPIVLLHASLGSKWQWKSLALRLAERYRVIGLDLHGYGDNETLPEPRATFGLDQEVALVSRHVDRLVASRERVHFVGHSYGGLVALAFAHTHPDRVASLALYEPVVFGVLERDDEARAEADTLASHVARLVATGHRHDAARIFVDYWSGDGSYTSMALPAQAGLAHRVDKLPLDFRAAMSWPNHPDDLRAIAAPALLLVGNRGPVIVQRIHALLERLLPNRRVAAFDCGHMGPVTHPLRINPWFEAFVDLCVEREAERALRTSASRGPGMSTLVDPMPSRTDTPHAGVLSP
jgi:pimeloyl-ACP methyl ester carboxylesterase